MKNPKKIRSLFLAGFFEVQLKSFMNQEADICNSYGKSRREKLHHDSEILIQKASI